MPSPYRILLVAVHAAAIAFFLAPPAAQASPMPMPLSSYSARNVYDAHAGPSRLPMARGALDLEDLPVAGGSDSPTIVPAVARDVNTSNILSNINILNNYYGRASANSKNLSASCLFILSSVCSRLLMSFVMTTRVIRRTVIVEWQ